MCPRGAENAGVENVGVNSSGGKCRSYNAYRQQSEETTVRYQ